MLNLCVFLCALGCLTAYGAFANILVIENNIISSYNSIAANFGRPVTESGEHGTIYLASPLDACSPLTNSLTKDTINSSSFVLIIRGVCGFVDKVRRAQDAGFKAAIVYNDRDGNLFPMTGDPDDIDIDIHIHAVFVSLSTGLKLQKYVGVKEVEIWLTQSYGNSAWSIMAVFFILLLAMSAVISICFFIRRHGIRYDHNPRPRIHVFRGMSSQLVKAMASLEFTEDLEDNCTSGTCAICLDDYAVGDKIRILPCNHKFHMICVDAWLTSWRTFCPVCKRDANTTIPNPPATERTPLLSSTPTSVASSLSSSAMSASARSSSYVSSRPMQIGRSPTSLPYTPRQSRYPGSARSSLDMRNASSSFRSRGSYFNSNSFASPSLSPYNSIYTAFYSNSGNGSPSYIRSSNQQAHPLLRRESAAQSPIQC